MIRELPSFSDTIVVALTASVMNEEIDQLRTEGFDGAIAKPLNREKFPDLLEKILASEKVWHIA
jgi:CheY-like chemotaxis protein